VNEAGLAYETFRSQAREEYVMRLGRAEASAVLFVPPLFEEMNRTRALLAGVMRRLAARGLAGWLPDLRGTGESPESLQDVAWDDWRHDVMAAAAHVVRRCGTPPLVASLRGGGLIDDGAAAIGWWRLAPVAGASLARDMARAGLAGVEWAGYAPSPALRASLEAAKPAELAPLRTVRLASDAGAADARLAGPALWRRSEPGNSDELADGMAADIAAWHATCGAC
jgi:alpha-beta hydrolase superfamily lysophospholipase